MSSRDNHDEEPWIQITEQPKSKAHRFRYECEGRSAGSIPGENSALDKKSFPSIKIHNYAGEAVVVISCLTKDTPPRPHPHSVVGTNCNKGVFTQKFQVTGEPISFPNLGIRCAKKKEIQEALKQREEIRVDPYRTGFSNPGNSVDLNVVRLCFQVFLPGNQGKFNRIVSPVLSQPVYDKKSAGDLIINRLSRNSGSAKGGDEIFLLCDKVTKDDIKVKICLYNEGDDTIVWESWGEFTVADVHHQYAIVFKTPPFRDKNLQSPVSVYIVLHRPSDGDESEGRSFRYVPDDDDPEAIREKRKRKRIAAVAQDIPSVVDEETYSQIDPVRQKIRETLITKRRKVVLEESEETEESQDIDTSQSSQDTNYVVDPQQIQVIHYPGSFGPASEYTEFNGEELSAMANFMLTNNNTETVQWDGGDVEGEHVTLLNLDVNQLQQQ